MYVPQLFVPTMGLLQKLVYISIALQAVLTLGSSIITGREMSIKAVTSPIQHAEGPVWNNRSNHLLYVDTFKATAYRWDYKTGRNSFYKLDNHNSIGVIIPVRNSIDHYVVGADRDLYSFRWPEDTLVATKLAKLHQVDQNKPTNQFNDGKADNKGRLWIGTLTRNADLSVTDFGGSLYMLKGEAFTDETEKINYTSISNGVDWSLDYTKFYFIDSKTRTVVAYDYNQESGKIDNRQILFDLGDHPEISGIPDGMTIDSNGNLWVALFGGKAILNIDSKTGKILQTVKMPTTYVTSGCFGGPNLDILYVTTSRLHLDEKQLLEEPEAGSVFAIENLGVSGRLVNEVDV